MTQGGQDSAGVSIAPPTEDRGGFVNNSGQGRGTPVPVEIQGWSWAGFLMSWIWAFAHKASAAAALTLLLAFFGPATIIGSVICAVKGNEWAWQNRRWESLEQFKNTQRVWMNVGIVIWGLAVVVLLLFLPDIREAMGIDKGHYVYMR